MSAPRVVPTLNPGKNGQTRIRLGLPCPPSNQLALHRGEEALSDSTKEAAKPNGCTGQAARGAESASPESLPIGAQ